MKRLTKINENGKAYYPDCFTKCNGIGSSAKCNRCEISEKACETLAAYENTGLTPVQILELDEMYQELSKEVMQYRKAAESNSWILCSERLPEVGKTVLVCYWSPRETIIAIAKMNEYKNKKYWDIKAPVYAWQTLPEPYRLDAITEDAKKDAFIGGIELGIDWGFKDIPPEDIELYHQLIKERETKNLGR